MTTTSSRKPDRSLAIAMLTALAIGNGLIGGFTCYVSSQMRAMLSVFDGDAGELFARPELWVTMVGGFVCFALCAPLLHASSVVARSGVTRFVVIAAAVACIVDVAVLRTSAASIVPLVTLAAVLHTRWALSRPRAQAGALARA